LTIFFAFAPYRLGNPSPKRQLTNLIAAADKCILPWGRLPGIFVMFLYHKTGAIPLSLAKEQNRSPLENVLLLQELWFGNCFIKSRGDMIGDAYHTLP
jgi:hypothetical protein